MEKIILAIDAVNLNTPALDFACYLATLTRSKLTGIFLENIAAGEPELPQRIGPLPPAYNDQADTLVDRRKIIDGNIVRFREACEQRSVRYTIHRDRGIPVSEMILESRYADLMIVDAATTFSKIFDGTPSNFVKDVLKDAECPVIIPPENFKQIDEIILTYDGSKSSVFAIKQFAYLLPQLSDTRVFVLQVNKSGDLSLTDKHNIGEWLQNYFSVVGFQTLKGDPTDRLFDFLIKRKNAVIVMGAYGRSALSRFFHHSEADLLINTISQTIFIAHC